MGVYPLRGLTPCRRGSRLRQGKHVVSALLRMIVPRFAVKSTPFMRDVGKVTRFVKSTGKAMPEGVYIVSERGEVRNRTPRECAVRGPYRLVNCGGLVLRGELQATR